MKQLVIAGLALALAAPAWGTSIEFSFSGTGGVIDIPGYDNPEKYNLNGGDIVDTAGTFCFDTDLISTLDASFSTDPITGENTLAGFQYEGTFATYGTISFDGTLLSVAPEQNARISFVHSPGTMYEIYWSVPLVAEDGERFTHTMGGNGLLADFNISEEFWTNSADPLASLFGGLTHLPYYGTVPFLASNDILIGIQASGDINSMPAPVPEPATMFLLGTGLVGLVGARIRRKK